MSRTHHHGRKQKRKLFGPSWRWWRASPKSFRNTHKHRPQRTEARRCAHRVMRGDDCVLWPLDRKPRIYYW